MSDSVDQQTRTAAAVTALTGPGGPFEMVTEEVRGVPMPVLRQRARCLGDVLAESMRWGERDYLVTADRRLSFAEHAAAANALACALRERYGIGSGDRVGILAANTIEWVLTFWASQLLGAIAVGYNAWWARPEIEYGLGHTRPAVLVADATRATVLAESATSTPVLTMGRDIPALISEFAGRSPEPVMVGEDEPAVILYTSGTSGRPKGVTHSHRNLIAVIGYHAYNDALIAALSGAEPSRRCFLLTSPLFHIASLHNLVVPRLVTGDTAVIHQGSFDADRVLRLMERERVTNWGAMPTMAARLLEQDLSRYDLSALRAFSLNSAPSSATLQQRLRDRLPVARTALVTSYGLTECSTAATLATPAELAEFPDTVGRPVLGVELGIHDATGAPVADGTEGEIWVRSPYVMLGYWEDEAASAAAITPEGWLRTGDIGTVEDGRLRLSGRRSDLILRGGENVYPSEVEQCLEAHPAVRECAVIGVPDADLGQAVGAVVVVGAADSVTADELRAFVAERVAYYKVPSSWRLTSDPLPRNATGKVVRTGIEL
ncbi:class I adenylate-forming enzyme family protein [Nocardia donostiensis]|uniref:Fatty acid--CoA ligase n=1 Tax=Nocardia donostiensis TaxID=1538463 RepID=A0A1W0BCU9_9NOCA|nr:class I adenylate-forming enzyme family protein [Nocardia donostiensis]ONM48126.1 fatty acid--CoA ligase [Nocardia donostiensis]OQS13886.1 fatty acid--CoA ligase [Nocardia donostiensis]OQS20355.1 fatty acid--CoA ligase [Nocardia donostiensis]